MFSLKNLVFDVSFVDPMSTLAIFLLWLHYYMMFFVCLVLIFVFFAIIKLINNYNWTVFQRSPFYFDSLYKYSFFLNFNYYVYSFIYFIWLRFCEFFLLLFRVTYLKLPLAFLKYRIRFKRHYTWGVWPRIIGIKYIGLDSSVRYPLKLKLLNKFGKINSKSKIITSFFFFFNVLNSREVKKTTNDLLFLYDLNKRNYVTREFFRYSYMSNLLHDFSSQGYFNSKVRLHLNKYSEFFHMYFWRSNLVFELQLAFIPFVIAVFLIVPSVIVTTFITDPEKNGNYNFDENSLVDNWIDYTVDVIGHQWYWSYKFTDFYQIKSPVFPSFDKFYETIINTGWDNKTYVAPADSLILITLRNMLYPILPTESFEFNIESSNLSVLTEEDFASNKKRLVTVDKKLFLKSGSRTKFLITSADVLHSFSLPALGVKLDAIPYRLSYQVPRIRNYEAILYGFCSELCGVQHAQMPIEAIVLPEGALHPEFPDKGKL